MESVERGIKNGFLVACKRLYKSLCRFTRLSVRWNVSPREFEPKSYLTSVSAPADPHACRVTRLMLLTLYTLHGPGLDLHIEGPKADPRCGAP